MTFDYVHHIQIAYRRLVDCLAKPGNISELGDICREMDFVVNCRKTTLLLMLMLLDTEVSFHIVARNSENLSNYISQLTYSPSVPIETADFIFLLQDRADDQFAGAMTRCKMGDLINPHKSATLIIEVEQIAKGGELKLTGPGIARASYISISQPGSGWIEARSEKNIEYPLGLDLFFVSSENSIIGLPRTTVIDYVAKETEVTGDGIRSC